VRIRRRTCAIVVIRREGRSGERYFDGVPLQAFLPAPPLRGRHDPSRSAGGESRRQMKVILSIVELLRDAAVGALNERDPVPAIHQDDG
jgi:hypothetical protein